MERKKALAVAVAITSVLGSTTVAFASVGGGSLLGFGGSPDAGIGSVTPAQLEAANGAGVVSRTRNVYDKVVVGGEAPSSSAKLAAARAASQAPAASPSNAPVAGATPTTEPDDAPETDAPHPARHAPIRPPVTTRAPANEPARNEPSDAPTSTTSAPVTTTTRPRGVPADWPPDKPIPPMPPNCRQPQLEDNGVWNCQDD